MCQFEKDAENMEIMKRILQVGQYNGVSYVQIYERYCGLAMNKFLKYDDQPYSLEKEAKIYYVYKTIVRTARSKEKYMHLLKDEESNSVLFTKFNVCASGSIGWFTIAQSIKLWYNIILDKYAVRNGKFDLAKAQRKIFTIVDKVLSKIFDNTGLEGNLEQNK